VPIRCSAWGGRTEGHEVVKQKGQTGPQDEPDPLDDLVGEVDDIEEIRQVAHEDAVAVATWITAVDIVAPQAYDEGKRDARQPQSRGGGPKPGAGRRPKLPDATTLAQLVEEERAQHPDLAMKAIYQRVGEQYDVGGDAVRKALRRAR